MMTDKQYGNRLFGAALVILTFIVLIIACAAAEVRAADTLWALNAQRAYFGLYPLQSDPVLQAKAEQSAQTRAARGISGHLRSGFAPGRAEGVGMRSTNDPRGYRFLTCMQNTRKYRRAGAATVVGRGGTYYVLILR